MRLIILSVLFFISTFQLFAKQGKEKFIVGFSQCISSDTWRQTMQTEMQTELVLYPNFELLIKDAGGNNQKQVQDVEDFLKMGIDLLIISPNESKPLTPIVQKVFKQGIPVIVIDRKIESDDYTAFIGANNYEIGTAVGQYAVNLLKGKGDVVEIWGLKGSSPAQERHKGFSDAISNFPDVHVVFSETGEWEEDGGRKRMEDAMSKLDHIDLVFAHNDYMAKGAWDAAHEKNKDNEIAFLGIDGLPGENGGVQQVIDKRFTATFLYPTGGDKAIDLAWQILNNEPYEKQITLQTVVIDSSNATVIKVQTDQILTLQDKIQSFKSIIDEQLIKYNGQRTILIISLSFLFVVVSLVFLLFTAYRSKNIINIKLEQSRESIQKRNSELIEISNKLEDATQAKLRFFTNLSHEFRTPLTLIIGPLEALLSDKTLTKDERMTFERMNRNANRLLRMINQLMDLRKIENSKMDLQIGKYNLVAFLNEIKESFNELAKQKNIDFSFRSPVNNLDLWFDFDKLDKVFFNLLSNAYKFTLEEGSIAIALNNTMHNFDGKQQDAVEIEIRDSGRGMSPEHVERIFDRFYQIEHAGQNLGTGLGLSLTKSFIELHKGDIQVNSQKGKGTSCYIYLRKGKNHFLNNELICEQEEKRQHMQIKEFPEVMPIIKNQNEEVETQFSDKPYVLVVEDHADVRAYINDSLKKNYQIAEVENGLQALQSIEDNEPDLIVSDVMMPGMNGLELTRKIKTDLKTCHIPVILLTAKTSEENKIEGIEDGADSYIPKPFNSRHLEVRVKKLIEGRRNIRAFYKQNYTAIDKLDEQVTLLDKKFVRKVNDIIDQHLADNNFRVEELSEEIGMSRVHFYRKIKSLTDMTATEYLRNYKLKKAAILLRNHEFTISEIAYRTGFSSTSYFSKCFKELYNLTPQQYTNS
jgi:signal transduction histidine kinase/DNA-binding response OmpR family regulator